MADGSGLGGLRQQALQAAGAAVPSVGSIRQQFGQSIQDESGFTQALMQLLQQGGGASVAGGYAPAIAQQGAIGQAAAARLATITGGSPMGASSGATVGGLADSAMSRLVANQAAARSYAGQLPAAAMARGVLADKSLIDARNQALQARQQQFSQAFQSALGQIRQNQLALHEFNVNAGFQQAGLSGYMPNGQPTFARQQLNAENARYLAGLNNQRLLYGIRYGGAGGSTVTGAGLLKGMGLTRATGLTAGEVNVQVAKADAILQPALKTRSVPIYAYKDPATGKVWGKEQPGQKFVRIVVGYHSLPAGQPGEPGVGGGSPVTSGVPFARALQELEQQGIQAPIAFYAAARLYTQARGQGGGATPAYNSFVQWMGNNGFPSYRRQWRLMQTTQRTSRGPQNAGLP